LGPALVNSSSLVKQSILQAPFAATIGDLPAFLDTGIQGMARLVKEIKEGSSPGAAVAAVAYTSSSSQDHNPRGSNTSSSLGSSSPDYAGCSSSSSSSCSYNSNSSSMGGSRPPICTQPMAMSGNVHHVPRPDSPRSYNHAAAHGDVAPGVSMPYIGGSLGGKELPLGMDSGSFGTVVNAQRLRADIAAGRVRGEVIEIEPFAVATFKKGAFMTADLLVKGAPFRIGCCEYPVNVWGVQDASWDYTLGAAEMVAHGIVLDPSRAQVHMNVYPQQLVEGASLQHCIQPGWNQLHHQQWLPLYWRKFPISVRSSSSGSSSSSSRGCG
jgi:hypothetical protein